MCVAVDATYLPQLPALVQQLLKSPQLTKQGFINLCKPALDAFLGIAANPATAKPTDVANLACPALKVRPYGCVGGLVWWVGGK